MLKRGVFLIIFACCSLGLCLPDPNTLPPTQTNTQPIISPNTPLVTANVQPTASITDSNTPKNSSGKLTFDDYIKLGKFILAVITAIVLAIWAIYKWRHRGKSEQVNPTSIKVSGDNTAPIAGRDINTGGGVITTTTHIGLDPEKLLNTLTEKAEKAGKLEAEIGQLKTDLANALNRVAELEKTGRHKDAAAALGAIRKSGDAAKLQQVLIADKNLHKDALIERNREISAVAYLRGDIDIALAAVDEILKLLPDDLDALNRKGIICKLRGNLPEATQSYEKVLSLAKIQNNEHAQAAAYGNLGVVYTTKGELDKAVEMYNKALAIDEKLGRQEGMASTYSNLGIVYEIKGELDKAVEMYNKALAIDEKLGGQEGMAINYGNLGIVYGIKGELDKAVEMFNKALAINKKLGRQEGMASNYGNLGNVYQIKGELDKAVEMYNKALAIDEKLGRQEGMANQYGNLGIVYRIKGELDKAVEMHNKALAIDEKLGRQEGVASNYGNLGNVYQIKGELDKAVEMHNKALAIDEKLGGQEGMASAYGSLGTVYQIKGDKQKAREYYLKSIELFRKIGAPHMIKKVEGWLKKLDDK